MLRYQVTRSSLISDRQISEKRPEASSSNQLAASKTDAPTGGAQFLRIRGWKTLLIIIALGSLAPLLKSNRIPVASRFVSVNDVCFSSFPSPPLSFPSLSPFYVLIMYLVYPFSSLPTSFLLGLTLLMVTRSVCQRSKRVSPLARRNQRKCKCNRLAWIRNRCIVM